MLTFDKMKSSRFIIKFCKVTIIVHFQYNIQIWNRWRRRWGIFYYRLTGIYRADVSMKVTILLIIRRRYAWMLSWISQRVNYFFSHKSFWINSALYEYKNWSANNGAQLVSIKIPSDCWKTWFLKINIDMVYQKVKHLFNVNFRVLVCTIQMCFNKLVLQTTDEKVSKLRDPFLLK